MWTHTHTSSLPLSFPGGSVVKNLPPMQEMRVQSLCHKGPLKECMATHSSILAWEIPWMEEPGRLWSMVAKTVGHDLQIKQHNYVLSSFHRVRLSTTLWTVARQAPLSMGLSGQEYWSGLPCPSPGDLPDPGIKPTSHTSTCIGKQVLYH